MIAIPYVPNAVTCSFHILLPYFLSAGCLKSMSWQHQSSRKQVTHPLGSVASAASASMQAGEGAGVSSSTKSLVGEYHPRE